MNLTKFKQKIEQLLSIVKWAPTNDELKEIARIIRAVPTNSLTKNDVSGAVSRVLGNQCIMYIGEGLDNSDTLTLLALVQQLGTDDD